MVKRFVKLVAICVMISPILLSSCQKDLYDPTVTVVSQEPSDLDFSTTQNVQFSLSYDAPTGLVADFDLYAENPCVVSSYGIFLKEGVEPIGSGVAVSGKFTNTKQFPAYVTELYAYSSSPFAPRLMHATISSNGVATFAVVTNSETAALQKSGTTRSTSNATFDLFLGKNFTTSDIDANGKPNYIDASKVINVSAATLNKITAAFPSGSNGKLTVPANSPYLKDATIHLEKKAKVWVTILVSDGDFTNEFGYFCYDGPQSDIPNLTAQQKADLKLISAFPQAKVKDSKNPTRTLLPGDYVQLKYYNKATGALEEEFPANTTIVWVLHPMHLTNSSINNLIKNTLIYSCTPWNPEATEELRKHNIYFNAGTANDPYICFGFEDMKNDGTWGGYFDRDCNDMMFNVQLDPINALDPPPTIEDPTDVVKYQHYKGYLGYEDYWPIFFDYDLNDLMVKYNSSVATRTQVGGSNPDTNVYVTKIEDEFNIIFDGATFHNKFSVIVPFNKSLVQKMTLINTVENTTEDITNSVEVDGNGFIIDICPDAIEAIGPTLVYPPIVPEEQTYIYKLSIELKDKVMKMSDFENNAWMAPYNPFITPYSPQKARTGDIEVHLPGYAPSKRAAAKWFGTNDDRSNPSRGQYYIGGDIHYDKDGNATKNIFPFAIHLSGVEKLPRIPAEQKRIDLSFPRYRSWAESGMTQDKDWYLY